MGNVSSDVDVQQNAM